MVSELKPLVVASVLPRQGDQLLAPSSSLSAVHSERETSGQEVKRAEVAGGGERRVSATPVWAISCVRAKQQPMLPSPRTKAAAEMVSELKPLAAASVMPGRVISCLRRAAACAAHSEKGKAAAEI